MSAAAEALSALLRSQEQALLSTVSKRHGGHPFGSLVPYALWEGRRPLLYLSGLAVHTANLLADPRASLLVWEAGATAAQPARATLVGRCEPLPEASQVAGRAAFAAAFPRSEALALGGFAAFVFTADEVRWIGGFGAAAWLPGSVLD